jgi:carbamoyl-phosphate synthase large subunit
MNGKVIGADMSETAPALFFVDDFAKLPYVLEDNYIDELIALIKAKNICMVVPTIDTELQILADNKMKIEFETSAKVMISSSKVIEVCNNKFFSYDFFEKNGFDLPKQISIDEDVQKFPVFIKPLNGSSSVNAYKVNNRKELDFFKYYIKEPIIQEFIEGIEYTIDICCNFNSKPLFIVPRKRIAVRSGEISKGQIIMDEDIIYTARKLIDVLKPVAQITLQCIKSKGRIFFIEVNARFGGGAPISIKAGANSPKLLLQLLNQEKVVPILNSQIKSDLLAMRYDQTIFVDPYGVQV